MTALLSTLAVASAFLIGSVPFGYLVVRWARGVDIRTVGSGNPGATNVGRFLGPRYFLLVMALDLLKGLLPTIGLPAAVSEATGAEVLSLPLLVALATILGHNFSPFLGFKGGKGVATSLGALLALDPAASLAAAVGFVAVLLITKYVSMSSILGGTCFVIVHFARVADPLGREEAAMTVLIAVLYVMLIVRHRPNLARIAAGTEPKVALRKRRPDGRAGIVALLGVSLVGLVATVGTVAVRMVDRPSLRIGDAELSTAFRIRTGHQRAGALTFFDGGRRLAVCCPRYNRVVLYRIDDDGRAELERDLALESRPVAIRATADRLYILQRPVADARHLEEGYWQSCDLRGDGLGAKFRVGWDPDDLALSTDGRIAFVLTSGHAEGEQGRPDPALVVVSLGDRFEDHRIIARLPFDGPFDDPEYLTLSDSGRFAAVAMAGSLQVACIDLSEPERPTLLGRVPLASREVPTLSAPVEGGDAILMPVDTDRVSVVIPGLPGKAGPVLASTVPDGSALEFVDGESRRILGRLALRGPFNLGEVRPTGLDYSPERSMLAVADRAGVAHLVAVRAPEEGTGPPIASNDPGRGSTAR